MEEATGYMPARQQDSAADDTAMEEGKSGFAWLDDDYDENAGAEETFSGIPKPASGEEVLNEIEAGEFSFGVIVNVGDDTISEKSYSDVTVKFRKQNSLFQADFHGSDANLQSIWQQLEIYGNALEKYTGTADSEAAVTCAIIFIPSKYMSTITFEMDMPLIWAVSASKIGYPADSIRVVAPTDFIGVYESGFDAEREMQNAAEEEARAAAEEDAETKRRNAEAYREVYRN